MGKGDKKTAKGKRWRGSYGNSRPKKSHSQSAAAAPAQPKKAAKKTG